MQLINFIKYNILKRPLALAKTEDYCASGEPQLTVVLIHGIASTSKGLGHAVKYLKGTRSMRHVRIVTFDLLGAGKSYRSRKLKYNYAEMCEALDNSIKNLHVTTPIVLVGHSMGSLIVAHYLQNHRRKVKRAILASPAFYTEKDLDNPDFDKALATFKQNAKKSRHHAVRDEIFDAEIEKIVKNRKNYEDLTKLDIPTTLIYGNEDRIIIPANLRAAAKVNPELSVVKTLGRHGLSREKYNKIREILEEML